MTIQELEQVIQDCLMDIYGKKYTGRLYIQKLNPVGYYIKFGMDRPYQPTVLYAELEDDKFLELLKRELKDKRFNLTYYGQLNLTHPSKQTSCHD